MESISFVRVVLSLLSRLHKRLFCRAFQNCILLAQDVTAHSLHEIIRIILVNTICIYLSFCATFDIHPGQMTSIYFAVKAV